MVNNLHKKYRPLFQIPENWIYFDGNSLGPLQKTIIKKVSNMMSNEWNLTKSNHQAEHEQRQDA